MRGSLIIHAKILVGNVIGLKMSLKLATTLTSPFRLQMLAISLVKKIIFRSL